MNKKIKKVTAKLILFTFSVGMLSGARADDSQMKRNQRIEDARASVKKRWVPLSDGITALSVGVNCGVIERLSADVAARRIQVAMRDEAVRAGLFGDPSLDIEKVTAEAVAAGRASVKGGACNRLTPAMRGELRAMASELMR